MESVKKSERSNMRNSPKQVDSATFGRPLKLVEAAPPPEDYRRRTSHQHPQLRQPRPNPIEPRPHPADLALILTTVTSHLPGAPWSVYDRASVGSWIDGELALLRDAHALDVPVLAICFGAQALAAALGGTVHRAPRPEIGWMAVESHEPGLVPAGPWFQSHFDRFSIPPGAVELARSTVGSQAFRIGRSLGVQFHPELTEEILQLWIGLGLAREARKLGLDPDEQLARTRALRQQSRQRAHDLVDAFLTQVVRAEGSPATETQPTC
jgi:GMP synthase-like glutamine amidotransferase